MKKTEDLVFLIVLSFYALFIWFRDTVWMASTDDTFPILVAIPLFYFLGQPWSLVETDKSLSVYKIAVAALLFLMGIASNYTIILAISWTLILWAWLSIRLPENRLAYVRRLLVFPFMAFPWISLDAAPVGWWFRLSGAWAASNFFSLMGADVTRQGTIMVVNEMPISVEVACAGLNTLQSMLIAGSVVAFIFLGNSSRFWWSFPILILLSWVTNTIRIIVITLAALWISRKFALGSFHEIGGWVVIMLMFGFSWLIFSWLEPKSGERPS